MCEIVEFFIKANMLDITIKIDIINEVFSLGKKKNIKFFFKKMIFN